MFDYADNSARLVKYERDMANLLRKPLPQDQEDVHILLAEMAILLTETYSQMHDLRAELAAERSRVEMPAEALSALLTSTTVENDHG